MPLRETRRFKTRGFVFSFGDIMLPVVGIVAVGLLGIAGRLFFLSGIQSDKQPLPVVAPPLSQERPAQAGTVTPEDIVVSIEPMPPFSTERPVAPPESTAASRAVPSALDVLAVPVTQSGRSDSDKPKQAESTSSRKTEPPKAVNVVTVPAAASKPKPAAVQPPQRQSRQATAPPKQDPPKQQKTQALSWSVQVGAFSTRGAAESVLQQLNKSGYSASIISGKTLSRVLVKAGATREDALTLATKLSRSGFQGAFIVPPR